VHRSTSGFGEASKRWSEQFRNADEAPDLAELPKLPNVNNAHSVWAMMRTVWETIWSTMFIVGCMAVLVVTLPFVKLALFHYQVWTAFKKRDFASATAVFVIACAPIDIGLIWGLVLVTRGDLALF
jgi:ABC-type sugar transport system permease subunit